MTTSIYHLLIESAIPDYGVALFFIINDAASLSVYRKACSCCLRIVAGHFVEMLPFITWYIASAFVGAGTEQYIHLAVHRPGMVTLRA